MRRENHSDFNYLTEHQDFLPTVQRVWSTTQPIHHSRTALSRFHAKLKLLKYNMRLLNKTHYGDLPARTKQAFDCWNKLASIDEKFFVRSPALDGLAQEIIIQSFSIMRCRPGLRGIRLKSLLQRQE